MRRHIYDCSVDPTLGRMRRDVASWVGLILLAFNLMGAWALPAQAQGAATLPMAQALLEDRIVVCTAAGMVVMDRDGNILNQEKSGENASLCVFCLPLTQGGVQAPTLMEVVVHDDVPSWPVLAFADTVIATAKPAVLLGASSPRAPPLGH